MIYFIQECEPPYRIKIGFSKNPEKRFRAIAAGLPQKVVLLRTVAGSIEDERFFHKHFIGSRVPGTREWYLPSHEILEFIETPVAC